ncbi:MAG: bifunctional 2-keto-4-hydroxyglutarate aldolase/2-keto-3-deoxy-6-phosphogluconate aldolase [Eubacteriales bacterium]
MDNILKGMCESRLVAVIRASETDTAIRTAEACVRGGIKFIEITFTVPCAENVIRELCEKFGRNGVTVGAGTVLDAQTARIAVLAGAGFVVSPTTDEEMISLCKRYRVVCAAGAFTPNEVKRALECGADLIKIFPGSLCGPSYLEALRGPFPQAEFMVTGNMTYESIGEWMSCGASVVGVGGLITSPSANGDYARISDNARKLVGIVSEVK